MTDVNPNEIMPYDPTDFLPIIPPKAQAKRIPRVTIPQPMSTAHVVAGGVGQYFVDYQDVERQNEYRKELRVFLIDGDLPSRTMWAYSPDGKTDMGNKTPWCASSDGVKPRGGSFGYVGKEYVDWRDNTRVRIGEECKGCRMAEWKPIIKDGKVAINQATGKPMMGKPPCQETPQFIFWDFDLKIGFIIQAKNASVRTHFKGGKSKNASGSMVNVPGVATFFTPTGMKDGKYVTPTMPDGSTIYPLVLTVTPEPNSYGSLTFIPVLTVGKTPITEEERAELGQQMKLYREPMDDSGFTLRDRLLGKGYDISADEIQTYVDSEGDDIPF